MKNIILIGMKGCGKTTIGKLLAKELSMDFVELDEQVKVLHEGDSGDSLSCREIFNYKGETYFRRLETEALRIVAGKKDIVLSCGGGTLIPETNQPLLQSMGTVVFLDTDEDVLLKRILVRGVPAFFPKTEDPVTSLHRILETRCPVYEKVAEIRLVLHDESPEEIVKCICERIGI